MKNNPIIDWATSFNKVTLLNSFLDQCYKRNFNSPVVISLESLGFSYLKQFLIHLKDIDRISTSNNNIVFESLISLQVKLEKENIHFNDYDTFLNIYKSEVKDYFIDVINKYIIPVIKEDLSQFISIFNDKKFIVYMNGDDQVGFPIEAIKYFNEHYNEIKSSLDNKIAKFDFSNLKTKPVYNNLDEILSVMYNDENSNISAMTRIHLFGIAYGVELNKMSGKEKKRLIDKATGGKESLYTELAKGISLYGLVSINDTSLIPILTNSKYHLKEIERLKLLEVELNNSIPNNDSNKNKKIEPSEYYSMFEKEFDTVVSDFNGGVMWTYNDKVLIISSSALGIYKRYNSNLYEIMKIITFDKKYNGSPQSALKLIKMNKNKL